ncbi:unnamed protein product [Caenorhabditis bovis]|uniref:Uncharacterized protein n=1 Tax=Caenorhabditis bovis TaxID=2654633 RepID=A0A8S1F8K8_9PELO|nr:unnamed protein product [Caenorhabditis bovis]
MTFSFVPRKPDDKLNLIANDRGIDIEELGDNVRKSFRSIIYLLGLVVFLLLVLIFMTAAPKYDGLEEEEEDNFTIKTWGDLLKAFPGPFDDNSGFENYLQYAYKYGRKYSDDTESFIRMFAYEKNKKRVEEYNAQKVHGNAIYGENDMSDWTDEEFQKMLLPKDFYKTLRKDAEFIKPIPDEFVNKTLTMSAIPDFFDWRDKNVITPVKAQGQCGSCWAFASTATVEAAWAIAHNGEMRNLSEQTLLDCDLVDNACDGGDEDKAFRFIHRNGLAYAKDLPYVAHRQNTCVVDDHWNTTKIKAAYFLHPDEDSIINWLLNFGPVNIGMSVIQPMRAYKGGVFTPSEYACKNEVIGLHALLITGYGTSKEGEKYWIVKNSWGNTWGVEHGYIYFARGINACGIEEEPIGILA